MDSDTQTFLYSGIVLVLIALIVIAIVLPVVLWVLAASFTGAGVVFAYASEQGFIGVAVFAACWFFMFPVMVIVSLIVGFFHVGSLFSFLARLRG